MSPALKRFFWSWTPVTMTSCKNTIVLVFLNFKHMQMSLRFLYTNVGRKWPVGLSPTFVLDFYVSLAVRKVPHQPRLQGLLVFVVFFPAAAILENEKTLETRLVPHQSPGENTSHTVVNGGQSRKCNNLVLVVTEFVNLVITPTR